jgi:hypothetical protein
MLSFSSLPPPPSLPPSVCLHPSLSRTQNERAAYRPIERRRCGTDGFLFTLAVTHITTGLYLSAEQDVLTFPCSGSLYVFLRHEMRNYTRH